MGYQPGHTAAALTFGLDPKDAEGRRLTLLGRAWHLDVAKFWVQRHLGDLMPGDESICVAPDDDDVQSHDARGSPLWGSLESH